MLTFFTNAFHSDPEAATRWVSQVEVRTHAQGGQPIWAAGGQFKFKTYTKLAVPMEEEAPPLAPIVPSASAPPAPPPQPQPQRSTGVLYRDQLGPRDRSPARVPPPYVSRAMFSNLNEMAQSVEISHAEPVPAVVLSLMLSLSLSSY